MSLRIMTHVAFSGRSKRRSRGAGNRRNSAGSGHSSETSAILPLASPDVRLRPWRFPTAPCSREPRSATSSTSRHTSCVRGRPSFLNWASLKTPAGSPRVYRRRDVEQVALDQASAARRGTDARGRAAEAPEEETAPGCRGRAGFFQSDELIGRNAARAVSDDGEAGVAIDSRNAGGVRAAGFVCQRRRRPPRGRRPRPFHLPASRAKTPAKPAPPQARACAIGTGAAQTLRVRRTAHRSGLGFSRTGCSAAW